MMEIDSRLTNNHFQCSHHNKGYCKFGDKCHFQHFHELCSRVICKEKECPSRHPKNCKNGDECRFFKKNICAYRHENEKTKTDEALDKLFELNKSLMREIEGLKDKNKILEEELKRYVTSMQDTEIEVKDDKVSHETTKNVKNDTIKLFLCDHCNFVSNLEERFKKHTENNHDQKENRFSCGQCDLICETEKELKEHTENNHGYLLCDICTEFELEWDEIDAMNEYA